MSDLLSARRRSALKGRLQLVLLAYGFAPTNLKVSEHSVSATFQVVDETITVTTPREDLDDVTVASNLIILAAQRGVKATRLPTRRRDVH